MKTKNSSMLFVTHDSSTLPDVSKSQFQIVENKENRITIDSSHIVHVDRSNLGTGLTKIGEIIRTGTTITEKIPVFATPVGETLPTTTPGTDILYVPGNTTDPNKDYYPFKAKLPVYEQALQNNRKLQEVGFYIGEDLQNIDNLIFSKHPDIDYRYIQYGRYGDVVECGEMILIEDLQPSEISKIEDVMVTSKDSALDAYYCKK